MSWVDLRNYTTKPTDVMATEVNARDIQGIARWCGGKAVEDAKASDPTDVARWIEVPTLKGVKKAKIGDYIVQTNGDGFQVWTKSSFESKFYEI